MADGTSHLARNVVLACGCWTNFLPQLHIPVCPVKGQMWATAPMEPSTLSHVIFIVGSSLQFSSPGGSSRDPEAPLPIPELCTHDRHGRRLVKHAYGRQRADGRVIFGGDRIRTTDDDFAVDPTGVKAHREHVAEIVNAEIMASPVELTWAGLMPFSSDGVALVGELASLGFPRLYLCNGFGPHGIMEGPAAAKVLADAVVGVAPLPPTFAAAFDPCRPGGVTLGDDI